MRGAHPERDIERAIEESGALRAGERVLAACSGGPDSVALTAALHAVAKRMRIGVRVAYVNHGVRGAAWQDECVVAQLAGGLGVPLEIVTLAQRRRDEQSLRAARYRALIAAAKRGACGVLATAHHAQDQSETVVLALLRGTGPAGLGGIPPRRTLEAGLDLARPLLRVAPDALRAYCHARALPYAVDSTNSDGGRRRNAVRRALATLRPLFPGLDRAVARAAEIVADERTGSPKAALRRGVRERFAADEELRGLDFVHVEAVVRALESGNSGTYYMKPGARLRIDRGRMRGIITKE